MKKFFALSALSLFVLAACQGEPQDGPYAQLAQCLTEKGVKFYGAFWCPNCADQKKLFGDDIRYISYVECDPRGDNAKPQECRDAGISRYPTWAFPGQDNVIGTTAPEILGKKANCEVKAGAESTEETEETTSDTPAASGKTENSADGDASAAPVEPPATAGEENPAS